MGAADILLLCLATFLLGLWSLQWFLHSLAIIVGKWRLHRKTVRSSLDPPPGVTIIKPLAGTDPNLVGNLETFFTSKYPKFELLFCIEHHDDPAIPVAKSLMAKYPYVDSQLFIGARQVGVNPKINNMISGYEAAKYSLLLISDAGLKTQENTLSDMVENLTEEVGLVHQLPYCADRPGFAANLEKVYFGTEHAKHYLSINSLNMNCVTGMACLVRKHVLDESGGLQAFSHYLAEDYQIARAIVDKGYKCKVCYQPALQNAGNISVDIFKDRMIRWTKLRWSLMPYMNLLEPSSQCFQLGFSVSWAVYYLFSWNVFIFYPIHIFTWLLLDYILIRTVQGGSLPFSNLEFLSAWLYREMLTFYFVFKVHYEPFFRWRAKTFILHWYGVGEPVENPKYTK